MIRDKIVFGVNNQKLREKLINEGEGLILEKAIQVSQNFEYCKQQMNILNAKSSQDVNYVNNRGRGRVLGQGDRLQHQGTQIPPQQNRIKQSTGGKCGTIHNQSDKKKCSVLWQTVSSVQDIQSLEISMPIKERCTPSD